MERGNYAVIVNIQTIILRLFSSEDLQIIKGFLTASVERIFSRFGLVHSKIRNRLGVEKSAKLDFLYNVSNKDVAIDEDHLE